MKLIKSAIIYAVELPAIADMEKHLSEGEFKPMMDLDSQRIGFVANEVGIFARPIAGHGNYGFVLRHDEKIIPKSAIQFELHSRINEIKATEGRKVGKNERTRISENVVSEMLPKALARTSYVTCFYRPVDKILIVATASKASADRVTSALIRAVGSVKATTIHIDGIKQSITSKLEEMLRQDNEDPQFGEFHVGGTVKLKNADKHVVSYKIEDLQSANEGILEAIDKQFQVVEIELSNEDIRFRLDSDFTLKGITFESSEDEPDSEDQEDVWMHEAAVQSLFVCNAAKKLRDLFEYKPSNEVTGENQ